MEINQSFIYSFNQSVKESFSQSVMAFVVSMVAGESIDWWEEVNGLISFGDKKNPWGSGDNEGDKWSTGQFEHPSLISNHVLPQLGVLINTAMFIVVKERLTDDKMMEAGKHLVLVGSLLVQKWLPEYC